MTAFYTPNDGFTANDATFYKNKVSQLHYTFQCINFQLTVYAFIKIIIRGTTVPHYEFAAKQPRKEHKLSGNNVSVKMKCKQGWGCKKYGNKEGMKTQGDYPAAEKSW